MASEPPCEERIVGGQEVSNSKLGEGETSGPQQEVSRDDVVDLHEVVTDIQKDQKQRANPIRPILGRSNEDENDPQEGRRCPNCVLL